MKPFFKGSGISGTMKIKAIDSQTGSFFEKVLQPEAGILGECLIGRDPRCGLVLAHPDVSPVHGRILFQPGGYWYTDLGSDRGSRVNNYSLSVSQAYLLRVGDMLRIGSFIENALYPTYEEVGYKAGRRKYGGDQ